MKKPFYIGLEVEKGFDGHRSSMVEVSGWKSKHSLETTLKGSYSKSKEVCSSLSTITKHSSASSWTKGTT